MKVVSKVNDGISNVLIVLLDLYAKITVLFILSIYIFNTHLFKLFSALILIIISKVPLQKKQNSTLIPPQVSSIVI